MSVPLGNPLQNFTAYSVFPDGTVRDLTTMASWSSSNPAAVVSSGVGSAHTAGIGTANIQASLGSVTGSATVNVTPVPSVPSLMLAVDTAHRLVSAANTGSNDVSVLAIQGDGTLLNVPGLPRSGGHSNR